MDTCHCYREILPARLKAIPFTPHMLDADYVEGLIQLHCMWLVGCKGGWVGAGAKVGGLAGCKGGLDRTGLGNGLECMQCWQQSWRVLLQLGWGVCDAIYEVVVLFLIMGGRVYVHVFHQFPGNNRAQDVLASTGLRTRQVLNLEISH